MVRVEAILTNSACLSIIVAVLVAMIAIGIQKPDMGSILAVRPDVPLLKGLGPVLNIILAYSKPLYLPLHNLPTEILTSTSRPCRLLLLPRRTQKPPRLHQSPPPRTITRRPLLHDHLRRDILLRWPPRRQPRARLRFSSSHENHIRHRAAHHHHRGRGEWIRGHQIHVLQAVERYECCE